MSIELMTLVWSRSRHSGSELLVLLAIADNADTNTHEAYPSVDYLCYKTRLTRRPVQRALQALYESGELELLKQGGFGDRANVYRIIPEALIRNPYTKGGVV